jgi:hypothetical protein
MKYIVAVCVLALLMSNCGSRIPRYYSERHENPVYINEDVGDMIDGEERHAYGLFPGVDGFVKAALYEHRSGGYRWEIHTETERLFAYNRNPQTIVTLADYLERYKKGVESDLEVEETWDVLSHDALGQPINLKDARSYAREINCWCGSCSDFGFCFGEGCTVPFGRPFPSMLPTRRMSVYSIDD